MNTDELLTTFRSDVPPADPARAEEAYALAVARASSFGRPRRPRTVLVVAAAALVIVPSAVAFGGKIASLFEGTPPPPEVSTTFAEFNNMPDAAVQDGMAWKWPSVDVSKAHGVIEVQTPDGPEDMWAAPNDEGSQCYFIDFANDPAGEHGIAGFGGCPPPTSPGDTKINYGDVWTYEHPDLMTVYGSVYVDAATVRLTFDDGTTATIPVVEHLFLDSTAKDVKAATVTALDAAGNQVAVWTNPADGSGS